MKIGAFAKKFNLNISTIRFYVNNGLLVPEKKNGQYDFSKDCISDMEIILKYKKYHFTVEEIQLLFFLEKASRFQDEVVRNVCSGILEEKLKKLRAERDVLNESIKELERDIENLPHFYSSEIFDSGIPFSFIPYLYCPKCQTPLKLDSASLSQGFIYQGNLWCECGYEARIKDGVIFCKDVSEDSPLKAFKNIESIISMAEEFSASYRSLIKKAYFWMYSSIIKYDLCNKQILVGPFTYNFILEYISKLGKENNYIIFDPSIKRIEKLKKYLSVYPYNFIFIVGNVLDIPIKMQSVDLYIDDYSTTNCLFTYNSFSVEYIAPLIKRGGIITGIFTNYKNAPKSLHNFKSINQNFPLEKMTLSHLKSKWSSQGLDILDEKNIGSTNSSEKHFEKNEIGETIEIWSYLSCNKK